MDRYRREDPVNLPITTRSAYGRTLTYITDPKLARAWLALTGRITVREDDLPHLATLGFTVTEVTP